MAEKIITLTRRDATDYDGALVYVPGNKRIRFGKLRVRIGWGCEYIRVEALQNADNVSPEEEVIYAGEFEIAILAK